MQTIYSEFKRVFSVSMYKNLKFKLAEMSFLKDFVSDVSGDLYPVLHKSDDCTEFVRNNIYEVENGRIKRMFCRFFPYASYEISILKYNEEVGFDFVLPNVEAKIFAKEDKICFVCENARYETKFSESIKEDFTLIVSCRPRAFDVYVKNNEKPEFVCTFNEEKFACSNECSVFSNGYVCLTAFGNTKIKSVYSYMDNGISVADIRPIKYENGDIMYEDGKIWFSASVRMQEGTYQGMFSWVPSTSEINLTGAVFYDCGDGFWRNYLAPSFVYHREKKQWYVWVSSFEHKHILAYSRFSGEVRFGINVVDAEFMEKASAKNVFNDFVGFEGDEDPNFVYDENTNKWLMAICRINPKTKQYKYVFFSSQNPFSDYEYIGCGLDGAETGGSFVKCDNELFFVCGNSFCNKSEYRIYSKTGMKTAKFNYPDGGFRGWGSVVPVNMASRTRYFWLTFDRHNGSDYNWSYGNLYCFEAEKLS